MTHNPHRILQQMLSKATELPEVDRNRTTQLAPPLTPTSINQTVTDCATAYQEGMPLRRAVVSMVQSRNPLAGAGQVPNPKQATQSCQTSISFHLFSCLIPKVFSRCSPPPVQETSNAAPGTSPPSNLFSIKCRALPLYKNRNHQIQV